MKVARVNTPYEVAKKIMFDRLVKEYPRDTASSLVEAWINKHYLGCTYDAKLGF